MFQKRTNILFEADQWALLTYLAKQKKTSVGNLIRRAVQSEYFNHDVTALQRERTISHIKELRSKVNSSFSHQEIQALIRHGRT